MTNPEEFLNEYSLDEIKKTLAEKSMKEIE